MDRQVFWVASAQVDETLGAVGAGVPAPRQSGAGVSYELAASSFEMSTPATYPALETVRSREPKLETTDGAPWRGVSCARALLVA